MKDRIDQMNVRVFQVPTDRPESDGTLKWNSTTMVLVLLNCGKIQGIGYTYSHPAARTLIFQTLKEHIVGQDPLEVPAIDLKLRQETRNLGTVGLVMQAISAVNFALWDLKAKLLNVSLADLLGIVREGIPIYGSGGFTSYTPQELTDQLAGWVQQGIPRVKMKIGRDSDADRQRVVLARKAIGPDAALFVDANGAYSRKLALAQADVFADLGVTWFEEPVSSDDLDGLHQLRNSGPAGMTITAGEYGDGPVYFQRMLAAQAVDVLMADGTRCGGVSGMMVADALCRGMQVPLSAHCAPNQHAHVGVALDQMRHVEYFHDHVRIERMFFSGALDPEQGELKPDRSRPGMGLELKEADVRPYEMN